MTDWIAVNNLVQLMLIICAPIVVFWVVRDIRRWMRWNGFRFLGIEWGNPTYLPPVGHVKTAREANRNPGAVVDDLAGADQPIFVYPRTSGLLTNAAQQARVELEQAIRTRIREGGLQDPENGSKTVIRPESMGQGAHRFLCPDCQEEVWYRCLCGFEEVDHDPK